MDKNKVTASELAEYIYCQCCWMDRLEGKKGITLQMEEGTYLHEKTNRQYFLVKFMKKLALLLIGASLALGIISGVIWYFSQNS